MIGLKYARKFVLKLFLTLFIVFQLISVLNYILYLPVNAQSTGKCGGVNGFVNWQKCLGLDGDPNYIAGSDTFFFINSGYTDFYNEKYSSFPAPEPCYAIAPATCPEVLSANEYALNATVAKIVSDIISFFLFIMVGIFVFLIFKAVFIYVTAGDNDDNIKKAKKTFATGGWGLLIVAIGFIVVGLVGSLLGLGNFWEIKLFL